MTAISVHTPRSSDLPDGYIPGTPLPTPIIDDKSRLSEPGKRRLKALSGPRPLSFVLQLIVTWLTIVFAIALAVQLQSIVASALLIVLIATRQNLLGLLVHEQVHFLCSRRKWGDIVTDLFAGWPILGMQVHSYANIHLAHHHHYFSDMDPDFYRKNGPDWSFPMAGRHLLWLFLSDAIGLTFLRLVAGKNTAKAKSDAKIGRRPSMPRAVRVAYYLAILALAWYWGILGLLLVYWFLPLIFLLPVIVRFGAICEHKYNVETRQLEDSTPIIVLRWWETVLLPNLNFNYHIYHHYYPGVSYSNLPKVHELFLDEGLVDETHVYLGYAAYIRDLLRPNPATSHSPLMPNAVSPS